MRRVGLALLLVVLGSAGCDKLISPDVAEIPFNLPSRMYSFDSSMFGAPAGLTAEVPCGGAPAAVANCCDPVAPLPPPVDCNATPLTCEPNESGTSVCTATVTVSQGQTMNLGMEVGQLSSYTGFVNIKIKRISYAVNANTLDVNLPDVFLYLGPQGAMKSTDAGVMKFGTMPAIAAKTMPAGDVMLSTSPKAADVLASFTQDIKAPFTFIAETTLKVSHPPTGKIDLTITGQMAVSP